MQFSPLVYWLGRRYQVYGVHGVYGVCENLVAYETHMLRAECINALAFV
jgi:hypothetical protein